MIILAAALSAVTAQARDIRYQISAPEDNESMLIDDDEHGTRIMLPDEYTDAVLSADYHYCVINPDALDGTLDDSAERIHGRITFDIRPRHVLSTNELNE